MFIRKLSQALYRVVPKRDFYDTELPEELTAEQQARIVQLQNNVVDLENYLERVYYLKRQGASTKEVQIPECLKVVIEEAAAEQLNEPVTAVPSSKKLPGRPKKTVSELSTSPKTQ